MAKFVQPNIVFDSSVAFMRNVNFATETSNRTIYYSTTGSDTTGDGTVGNPYATPLKCVQDIKDHVSNCVITVSGSGTGSFPITLDLKNEIAKKVFIDAELAFVGTTITDEASTFTVSKTSNRLFAYTLTKSGLTATADQYTGMFVTTTAKTALYPIAYNAAGTNSFEIEYVHNSLTTSTNIVSLGVTWTNPNAIANVFDLGFKSSKYGIISFTNMNLDGSTSQNLTFGTGQHEKMFNTCKITARGINVGDTGPGERVSIRFTQCYLVQNAGASANFLSVLSDPNYFLVRTAVYAPYASQSCMVIANCKQIKFNNGVHFRGAPAAFWGNQGNFQLSISQGFEYRNGTYLANPGPAGNIGWQNPSGSAPCFFEFQTVSSLFHHQPESGFKLYIPNLYGSLPAQIFNGVSSGFTLVDPKQDICILAPGLYPEYESQSTLVLADNSSGKITVGNITQNKNISISYDVSRGGLEEQGQIWLTNRNDSLISRTMEFDDAGITFTKDVSGNFINLGWASSSTGTIPSIKLAIQRIMI